LCLTVIIIIVVILHHYLSADQVVFDCHSLYDSNGGSVAVVTVNLNPLSLFAREPICFLTFCINLRCSHSFATVKFGVSNSPVSSGLAWDDTLGELILNRDELSGNSITWQSNAFMLYYRDWRLSVTAARPLSW
jgi:hypothetical protein